MKCWVLLQNIWAQRAFSWAPQATGFLLGSSLDIALLKGLYQLRHLDSSVRLRLICMQLVMGFGEILLAPSIEHK